jgi:hypothetical protein
MCFASTYLLSERRLQHLPASPAGGTRMYFSTPMFMTTTLFSRVVLRQTKNGFCTIPDSAWADLAQDLRDKYDAQLLVTNRSIYESDRELPAHYIVGVLIQRPVGMRVLFPIFLFMETRLYRIVRTYTTSRIPLAR